MLVPSSNLEGALSKGSTTTTHDEFTGDARETLHIEGGAITDLSSSAHTITNSGVAVVTTDVPFGTGVLEFDGATDDNLAMANDPGFQIGTGDFTMELFAFFTDISVPNTLLAKGDGAGAPTPYDFVLDWIQATGELRGLVWGNSATQVAWTPELSTWYHIAFVRSGGTVTLYVDGKALASSSQPNAPTGTSVDLAVGIWPAASFPAQPNPFYGKMAQVRIVKAAKYTSDFTPKWKPYAS